MIIKGKNVFLSGPMSDDPENYHVGDFAVAHNKVKSLGAVFIYDPAIVHLSRDRSSAKKLTHEDYVTMCLNELTSFVKGADRSPLKVYSVVVHLPGWENSPGAKIEHEVAIACGIPCIELDECE